MWRYRNASATAVRATIVNGNDTALRLLPRLKKITTLALYIGKDDNTLLDAAFNGMQGVEHIPDDELRMGCSYTESNEFISSEAGIKGSHFDWAPGCDPEAISFAAEFRDLNSLL